MQGDVFTEEMLQAYVTYQRKIARHLSLPPTPLEFIHYFND